MRVFFGSLAGLITAALWFAVLSSIGEMIFVAYNIAMTSMVLSFGQIVLIIALFTATLAGGVVANAIGERWWLAIVVAGFVITAATIITLLTPNPTWLSLAGVAAPLIAAEIANRATRAWTR
ncbi:hypothetical protein GJW-30_1_03477 [Variibacter gotjawalensis]|uniref:Uncharacterized protein n=1 Tax=Variibacter gotjawalensis TaxID=1333996 RepID=A0A0S3PYB8_9BRAD|nr:hypothetical protein [Variibacter gotjawalensis]NIK46763.1 MFS family permease [Variibacter gotjawalensis]RZS48667.1 hypothetical protein EV661_1082 [Variibacter gotjawalensis]BAT60927.1 hypothetical protein GJW-30_1_03477 [Variibacter gotjawalensis]